MFFNLELDNNSSLYEKTLSNSFNILISLFVFSTAGDSEHIKIIGLQSVLSSENLLYGLEPNTFSIKTRSESFGLVISFVLIKKPSFLQDSLNSIR